MAIDTLINEAKGMSDQDINEVIDLHIHSYRRIRQGSTHC